ncbi:MAG: hypothetical protein WKF77_14355 [Planctomycetaceae bacterium]
MHNIGIPGVDGGELATMEARRTPLLSIRVFTDLPPVVAAALRHQLMLSAMTPVAAVAVRPLVVMRVVQAVPLVHVRELHLQAR